MNHIRHSAMFDARYTSVTLIGCGGIGSSTALALGKMGVGELTLIDGDVVSEENMATQLHALRSLGQPKATALKELVEEFSDDTQIKTQVGVVTKESNISGSYIAVSAVDSIAARKEIWEATLGSCFGWYLDARMGAEVFQLHVVDLGNEADVDWYENKLSAEDDSLIPDDPCTQKATIYTSFVAAGIIGSAVKKIITSEHPGRILVYNIRNNFFFTEAG